MFKWGKISHHHHLFLNFTYFPFFLFTETKEVKYIQKTLCGGNMNPKDNGIQCNHFVFGPCSGKINEYNFFLWNWWVRWERQGLIYQTWAEQNSPQILRERTFKDWAGLFDETHVGSDCLDTAFSVCATLDSELKRSTLRSCPTASSAASWGLAQDWKYIVDAVLANPRFQLM